jgi:uncharacterized RDD family membrane protein YckC
LNQLNESERIVERQNFNMILPIAGFWRRFAAFLIDGLLLGTIGQIIGWSASSFWFSVGPHGRILGFVIILLYFGLMNSKLCNGQTIGKRVLKTAVRDKNNELISIKLALLRTCILGLPIILNGWVLPVSGTNILTWLVGIIVFGLGVSIIYTILFNRSSRQGMHDLICKTYVVHLKSDPWYRDSFPQSSRKHWVVSGIIVALAVVISTFGIFFSDIVISKTNLSDITNVQDILNNDNRYHTASVSIHNTTYTSNTFSGSRTKRWIKVDAWYKGVPSEEERSALVSNIANVVLEKTNNIDNYDSLAIIISSKYDFGIAYGYINFEENHSLDKWREEIRLSTN